MAAASNFLGINTGTDAARAAITKPGGIAYVLAYIIDTGRLWFFDGATPGGVALALRSDIASATAALKNASFAVTPVNKVYHCDTSGGALTATLPAGPAQWDEFSFVDTAGQAATHAITVALNGKNFQDGSTNPVIADAYGMLKIQFNGTQWVQVS
ncbi:MAG TPA: hypothetical protein VIJ42_10640 [Stellaceae bacterium]